MRIKHTEEFTEIRTIDEFKRICKGQKAKELTLRSEIAEAVAKFVSKNKPYTIFSIQAEGSDNYITYGIKMENNIGFYVLEGNFILV